MAGQHCCKATFLKINRLKLQKLLSHADQVKRKVNCSELSLEITLLGLPHILKATSEALPNPPVKVNFTFARSFQQDPC